MKLVHFKYEVVQVPMLGTGNGFRHLKESDCEHVSDACVHRVPAHPAWCCKLICQGWCDAILNDTVGELGQW